MTRKKLRRVLEDIRDILIILGLILLFKAYILDFCLVFGHSMEPNIKDSQIVLIKKWDIHLGEKGNGLNFYDTVVINDLTIEGVKQPINIVKRIIGLPGDKIEIIEGEVYRNGKKLEEPSIKEKAYQINQSFEIKEGQIFVMGDNRNHSTDSRHFGPVSIEKVSGEVIANFDAKWLASLSQLLREYFSLPSPI